MELWVLHAKWHLIPCRITVGLTCWSSWLALKSLWGFRLYCSLSECVWRVGAKIFLINFIWKQNKVMLKKFKKSLYFILFSSHLVVAHSIISRSPCPECKHQRQTFGKEHCYWWQAQVLPELKLPHVFNRLQLSFSSMDISGFFVSLCEGYCRQCSVAWGSSPWSSTLVILFDALQFFHRNSD